MPLVPSAFEPPRCASLDGFALEVLGPCLAAADFLAVKSSANDIRHVFGPDNDWPSAEITFEQNRADLERHAKEFERRDGFAYSMLKSPTEYVGCLYIKPVKSRIAQDPRKALFDAQAFFWLSSMSKALSAATVHAALDGWLSDHWPFRAVAWPGRTESWEEWERLARAKSHGPDRDGSL
jgi:hypothetical protein